MKESENETRTIKVNQTSLRNALDEAIKSAHNAWHGWSIPVFVNEETGKVYTGELCTTQTIFPDSILLFRVKRWSLDEIDDPGIEEDIECAFEFHVDEAVEYYQERLEREDLSVCQIPSYPDGTPAYEFEII